jgi:hypothetical protein
MAVLAAVVVVWLGVTLSAPGVGLLLAIAAVPPVIRTITVVHERQQLGKATSAIQTAVMFVTSLVVTGVMLAVAGFIAFWTFCLTCVAAAEATEVLPWSTEWLAMSFAVIVTLGVVAVLGSLFWNLVDARYRRDITKK